jgi:hypothetical protein
VFLSLNDSQRSSTERVGLFNQNPSISGDAPWLRHMAGRRLVAWEHHGTWFNIVQVWTIPGSASAMIAGCGACEEGKRHALAD